MRIIHNLDNMHMFFKNSIYCHNRNITKISKEATFDKINNVYLKFPIVRHKCIRKQNEVVRYSHLYVFNIILIVTGTDAG